MSLHKEFCRSCCKSVQYEDRLLRRGEKIAKVGLTSREQKIVRSGELMSQEIERIYLETFFFFFSLYASIKCLC